MSERMGEIKDEDDGGGSLFMCGARRRSAFQGQAGTITLTARCHNHHARLELELQHGRRETLKGGGSKMHGLRTGTVLELD